MKNTDLILNLIIPVILSYFIAFKSSDISYDYPDFIHEIYDEPLYKLILFILLAFITEKNFTCGLLGMIIVTFILSDFHLLSEGFSGPNLNNCNIYEKDKIDFTGTAFYPLNDNNRLLEVNQTSMNPHSKNIPHYDGEVDFNNQQNPDHISNNKKINNLNNEIDYWTLKANA